MILRLPLLLLTGICLPCAIPDARGAGKSEKGIMLRLLACEVAKEPAKVLLQTKESRSEALDLPSSGFSEPIAVSARSVELKAPDSDVPLCNITLPAEGKSFAVVLASEKPADFVPFVVRLDDDSFKAGDYFFINRSAKTVVLKLGGTEVILEAGKGVKSRPTEPVHNHHYNITMSDRSDAGDRIFASTRWLAENGNRSYVIFLAGSNGKTIYRSVDQSVDVEEPVGKKKKR
ncbi:MAG: hypothetical protein RLZZ214_2783 [Verrucomicrobiota bacterium]|jgi:hypothetical protein